MATTLWRWARPCALIVAAATAAAGLLLTGCGAGGADSGNPMAVGLATADGASGPVPTIAADEPMASLHLHFEIDPDSAGGTALRGAIAPGDVAVTGATPRVRLTLTSVNAGATTGQTSQTSREVPVIGGAVALTVGNLPARTTVARLECLDCSIRGSASFRGAIDLNAGANTRVVNPIGSALRRELVADVIETMVGTPQLLARAEPRLADAVTAAIGGVSRASASVYNDAFIAYAQRFATARPPATPSTPSTTAVSALQ